MDDAHSEPGRPAPGASSPLRTRPRFALLTLLLLTALTATAIVIWQQYAELVPMRAEVRRLRDEVGELSIDDEAKFHAIAVRMNDDHVWRWRIWIPEGRRYRVHHVSGEIPKSGLPRGHGAIEMEEAGEYWIEYRISRNSRDGSWRGTLITPGGSVGSSKLDWPDLDRTVSAGEGVFGATVVFEPGLPVLLKRHRISATANDSTSIEDPSAGFMVWLEPVP